MVLVFVIVKKYQLKKYSIISFFPYEPRLLGNPLEYAYKKYKLQKIE
jgi:hypothetical protein